MKKYNKNQKFLILGIRKNSVILGTNFGSPKFSITQPQWYGFSTEDKTVTFLSCMVIFDIHGVTERTFFFFEIPKVKSFQLRQTCKFSYYIFRESQQNVFSQLSRFWLFRFYPLPLAS